MELKKIIIIIFYYYTHTFTTYKRVTQNYPTNPQNKNNLKKYKQT